MHIAICDDNIADRKQSERLLKRESDRRAALNPLDILYIDSYGNADSLLQNPMQYDAFFIDMCKGDLNGLDVLIRLTEMGSTVPVVLCCSEIDYRTLTIPDSMRKKVLFLEKPIRTAHLSSTINLILDKLADVESTIELREDKDTYYVLEQEIMYAQESGRYVRVTLTDGRVVSICTTAINFYSQIEEKHPTFFAPDNKIIVNGRHIEKTAFHKVIMKDGQRFSVPGKIMGYAKKIHQEYS